MTTSLYERLGGADGIERLVDDIVEAHMHNPLIKSRFVPYREEPERLERIKGHICQFFSAGSGGPQQYDGRTMPDAHRGMNISEAEYMAAVDDIMQTLEHHDIDDTARKDVLMIAYTLRGEIMHV